MLIEIALLTAAAAGISSLLALRARRRARQAPVEEAKPAAPSSPPEELPIALGAVVQHDGMTRWLRARIALSDEGRTVSAVLIADEAGAELAVGVFAPPERDI